MCVSDLVEDIRDRVEYDADSGTYRLSHDWEETESVSTAVSIVVAYAQDADPTETESVDNTVDPDALDRLFHPEWTDDSRDDGAHLVFDLAGSQVTVHRGGEIVVRPHERTSE